jgi:hypothetical protein
MGHTRVSFGVLRESLPLSEHIQSFMWIVIESTTLQSTEVSTSQQALWNFLEDGAIVVRRCCRVIILITGIRHISRASDM